MIRIYGASDDLIEIEGDQTREFALEEDKQSHLAFSDGTVLSVRYDDDGIWRFGLVHPGRCVFNHKPAVSAASKEYTDIVTLEGEHVDWVIYGRTE